jgi:hypothetical protein
MDFYSEILGRNDDSVCFKYVELGIMKFIFDFKKGNKHFMWKICELKLYNFHPLLYVIKVNAILLFNKFYFVLKNKMKYKYWKFYH